MALLLEAELARLRGDCRGALRLAKDGATRAEAQGYCRHAALLHERSVELLRAERRIAEAKAALGRARECYRRWGATAKMEELEGRVQETLGLMGPRAVRRRADR